MASLCILYNLGEIFCTNIFSLELARIPFDGISFGLEKVLSCSTFFCLLEFSATESAWTLGSLFDVGFIYFFVTSVWARLLENIDEGLRLLFGRCWWLIWIDFIQLLLNCRSGTCSWLKGCNNLFLASFVPSLLVTWQFRWVLLILFRHRGTLSFLFHICMRWPKPMWSIASLGLLQRWYHFSLQNLVMQGFVFCNYWQIWFHITLLN